MASLGHIVVGIAAARAYRGAGQRASWRSMAGWSALSLAPDVDVIGFALGVDYAEPWGHRGAAHSLCVAVAPGVAIAVASLARGHAVRRTAAFAILVLASHSLLDTLTDGGLGCALFWPIDLTRYFAPWRPIPVAPIGLAFVSFAGAFVALTELVLFAPLLLYALRERRLAMPRGAAAVLATLWSAACWLIVSSDPVRDAVLGQALRDDTAYSAGFSEASFRRLAPGHTRQQVEDGLGRPYGESWMFAAADGAPVRAAASSAAALEGCRAVRFEAGTVVAAFNRDACDRLGVVKGASLEEVARRLGSPAESCWRYSWSRGGGHYRVRDVCFVGSTVDTLIRTWR